MTRGNVFKIHIHHVAIVFQVHKHIEEIASSREVPIQVVHQLVSSTAAGKERSGAVLSSLPARPRQGGPAEVHYRQRPRREGRPLRMLSQLTRHVQLSKASRAIASQPCPQAGVTAN